MVQNSRQINNDRTKIMIGLIVIGIALAGLALFAIGGGTTDIIESVFIILTIILVLGASAIMINKSKSVKKGLPAEDEMSKKVSWKAGAYSYFSTIWIAIAIMWYNTLGVDRLGLPRLDTVHMVGIIVLVSGIIYIGLALLFNRRGSV